jgi:stage V sporulation protein S
METYTMTTCIRVAANSPTASVAGAIAGVLRERGEAAVQAIGANAVNRALKATIIARSFLDLEAKDVFMVPSFVDIDIDGYERTALRLTVYAREK